MKNQWIDMMVNQMQVLNIKEYQWSKFPNLTKIKYKLINVVLVRFFEALRRFRIIKIMKFLKFIIYEINDFFAFNFLFIIIIKLKNVEKLIIYSILK